MRHRLITSDLPNLSPDGLHSRDVLHIAIQRKTGSVIYKNKAIGLEQSDRIVRCHMRYRQRIYPGQVSGPSQATHRHTIHSPPTPRGNLGSSISLYGEFGNWQIKVFGLYENTRVPRENGMES